MRIGFDAKRIFHNFTGLGNYSRTLVESLVRYYPEEEYHLFTPATSTHSRSQSFTDPSRFTVHTPNHSLSNLWRTFGSAQAARKAGVSLFHGLSNEIPKGLRRNGIKAVVTLHDLIFMRFPSHYPVVDRYIYRQKSAYSCREADVIITVSEHTKSDIIEFFNTSPDKIQVIYQTCHHQFYDRVPIEAQESVRLVHRLPESYALYVGSIIPRKNLLGILRALYSLSPEERLPLVVIGSGKSYLHQVKSYVNKYKLDKWIIFPDTIPFRDFPAIYQRAAMLLFPAFYEGFGIPVLEGLWSKIPVITSRLSALPEVAGSEAYFIDPHEPESIANAITAVTKDKNEARRRVEMGFIHAQKFHEKILASRLMDLYRQLSG